MLLPQRSENDDIWQWNAKAVLKNESQDAQNGDAKVKGVPGGREISHCAQAEKFDAGLQCVNCNTIKYSGWKATTTNGIHTRDKKVGDPRRINAGSIVGWWRHQTGLYNQNHAIGQDSKALKKVSYVILQCKRRQEQQQLTYGVFKPGASDRFM